MIKRLFLLFMFGCLSIAIFSQICFHKKNQFDADCKKHGYWIEVSKLNPDKKTFKGWYKHGQETKRCTYYNDGVKCLKIRYVNDSLMHLKRCDQDGNLEYKGSALWLTANNEMRFCWNGEFVFYNSHHRAIRKVKYDRGEEQDLE